MKLKKEKYTFFQTISVKLKTNFHPKILVKIHL